jgi:hypothetical protein
MTRRPLWRSSSRAIASVVVPMLMISEQPSGTARHRARDALLGLLVELLALAVGDVLGGRPGTRTPP